MIVCPRCHHHFSCTASELARFCLLCGTPLPVEEVADRPQITHPSEGNLLSNRYHLLESIGKGGMGEVHLAFDTICGRKIALKKIRTDLLEHPQIRHRFLKEAHITCQLTHPAIIPIYSIQSAQLCAFYTMPFVEGETLKQIFRKTRLQERKGEKAAQIGGSIPALMRPFTTICQAIAYAHAKGVLHRDIKPENIIVGKYGEVMILDWGLAKFLYGPHAEDDDVTLSPAIPMPEHAEITKIGKVVGTVAYMAPERALGEPATIQTDIYALGVILYQILTLQIPYRRGSLAEFRKRMDKEVWLDPVQLAPYRDVPRMLSRIAEKCLQKNPSQRYQTVDEMIFELENYLQGRSEWFHAGDLDVKNKPDWEFQELVLIAEHIAITSATEEAEWVNLMISRQSFTGNTRIETSICLGDSAHGIGLLFSIPEMSDRSHLNEGYCLWLSSDLHRSTKLLRSNVEVMEAPDIILKRNQWVDIRIEKIDKSIHFYIGDVLQFSYIAHLPLVGTHIGLLSRDADYHIRPLKVSVGSLNLTVNCLAVPDAFLAHRDFAQALSDYRRIAYSFPDRIEGREALFRAGLTYIEQSKGSSDKAALLEKALQEFEKLHGTPGGPLEYLGKALVYQLLQEDEEEIKCFEIAYRRYPNHPLLPMLQEQILSRMHQVSRQNRLATYRFLLLTARHFSLSSIDTHTKRLFASLHKHWEALPFIEEAALKIHPSQMRRTAIPLAFWLAKPYILGEIIEELLDLKQPSTVDLQNAFAGIIELGAGDYALQLIDKIKHVKPDFAELSLPEIERMAALEKKPIVPALQSLFEDLPEILEFSHMRTLHYAIDRATDQHQIEAALQAITRVPIAELPYDVRLRFQIQKIWALLLEKKWKEAGEEIYTYPLELINKGATPLHFLYGCWLQATEGTEMAMIHFTGLMHVSHPRSWNLATQELLGELQPGWLENAFLWEKRELYRHLALYYHCAGQDRESALFQQRYREQFLTS